MKIKFVPLLIGSLGTEPKTREERLNESGIQRSTSKMGCVDTEGGAEIFRRLFLLNI